MNESFYIYIWKLVLGFVHLLGLSENHISKSQFQKNVLLSPFFTLGLGLVEEVLHTGEIPYYLSDLTGIDIFFFLELEIFVWCWIIAYTLFDKNLKRSIFSHRMHMLSMPADVLYSK